MAKLSNSWQQIPHGLRTRFAPSPTGHLHLGHAASALMVWGIAAATHSEVVLRFEDHDQGRCRKEYEESILDDLRWLGLVSEATQIVRQSEHWSRYSDAAKLLDQQGLTYRCNCSRRSITERTAASKQSELRYDGYCRGRALNADDSGLRLILGSDTLQFFDHFNGPQIQQPSLETGDLLIQERNGHWTYNFAVAVDDIAEDIGLVIRGQDILAATGRQLMLRQSLSCQKSLEFFHHPLIIDETGEKLSKRRSSPSLKSLRQQNLKPSQVFGMAAQKIGLTTHLVELTPSELKDFLF